MTAIRLRNDYGKHFNEVVKMLSKNPDQRWEEMLTFEEKLMLYESGFKLEGTVSEQQIAEFETELALKGYFGTPQKLSAKAKQSIPLGDSKL